MSYPVSYSQAILVLVYIGDKLRQGLHDYVPTRAIASSLGMSAPTTAKIMQALLRSGLIETREGAHGGVRLAVPAAGISLRDVLEALEQKRPLFQVHGRVRATGERPTRAQAAIRNALARAEHAMCDELAATSVQDLLATFGAARTGCATVARPTGSRRRTTGDGG